MLFRDPSNPAEIAGHSHLMHTKNGSRQRADGSLNKVGINVEGIRTYVHENRRCLAVTNAVCSRNIRMANRDDFVPRTDAGSKQGQM
jgi:hypothetical protein